MAFQQRRRAGLALIASLVLCTALAACGGGGGATSNSTGSLDLEAAEAAVAEYSAKPTTIPVSAPLAGKPKPGETFIWMTCQLSGCALLAEHIKDAVEAVGWNYQQITYDQADPASLVSGMKQALRHDPSYVAMSGVAMESWASVIPEYEAAGVKIVASYLGRVELSDTVIVDVNGESLNALMGKQLAHWFIADSAGEGRALLQTVNDYPSNKVMGESFEATVSKECPECSVETMDISLADAGQGQAVPQVVSQLRTKPGTTHLVGTYLPFLTGLSAALKAAGLEDKVKVGGGYADSAEFPLIHSGDIAAGTTTSGLLAAYGMVDAAVRDATGTPQPTNADQSQLLVPGGDFPTGGAYEEPPDAADQYKKLWGVS